jgi:aspartyl protease family protein
VSDVAAQAMITALLLILPLSALASRRLPMGTVLRYAGAWLAIFALGFLLIRTFT